MKAINRQTEIKVKELRKNGKTKSGRVREFELPGGNSRVYEITTFLPEGIGPGPVNVYLVCTNALFLMDMGIPTHYAKFLFGGFWRQTFHPEFAAVPDDYSLTELTSALALVGKSLKDLDGMVISHGHADHFLLGKAIKEVKDIPVAAHVLDTPLICNPWAWTVFWVTRYKRVRAIGMPLTEKDSQKGLAPKPPKDINLLRASLDVDTPLYGHVPLAFNGQTVEGVTVNHLPGHSPGSVGLVVGDTEKDHVLLSGDVLLNPTTPHPDDLLIYLRTLNKLAQKKGSFFALPGHGEIIADPQKRAWEIICHHKKRLQNVYEACVKPRSVWEVTTTKDVFDVFVDPAQQNILAADEAMAHLDLLQMADAVMPHRVQDGVQYFINGGKPFEEAWEAVLELISDTKTTSLLRM